MTALVWVLVPDGVVLGMDSLSVRADDRVAHKYCSKIMPLPHLSAVVCGTGSPRLTLEWYLDVQTNLVAWDIDYINGIAPERLRDIAARLSEPTTSTVYHFGYSPQEKAFTGIAFRSRNDFAAEPLGYSIGVKPGDEAIATTAEETLEHHGYMNGIVNLIQRLREVDNAKPTPERVGIGGEIHLVLLNGDGLFQQVAYRWDDFGDVFNEMLENLNT